MTPAERGFHHFQHAYFDAPRDRRGGRILGVQPGAVGAALRAMVAVLGYVPWLPVGDGCCRVCEADRDGVEVPVIRTPLT